MKAACTAAERGHKVTLLEKQDKLGGQLLLNRLIPGREELVCAATDLINNLDALDVDILMGKEADVSLIKEMSPDAVVIATGATPIKLEIPGIDNPNVIQAWDILAGKKLAGKKVVVVGGNAVGLETALYLAFQGTISPEILHFLMINRAESIETLTELLNRGDKDVTVVEMTNKAGKDISASTRWTIMAELKRLGVTIMTGTKAIGSTPEGLEVEREDGPGLLSADSIVVAAGSRSEDLLANELENMVPEIHIIGDAKQPRNALEAIKEGFLVGLEI